MPNYGTSRKIIKIISYFLVSIGVVILVSVLLFTFSSQELRRDLLVRAIEAGTGGQVTIGAPFRLELGRELELEIHDLQVGRKEEAGGFRLEAERAGLRFPLLPLLLQRRLQLTLNLENGRLQLPVEEEEETFAFPVTLVPVEIVVRDLSLLVGGSPDAISLTHFLLDEENAGIAIDLEGSWRDLPLRLKSVLDREGEERQGRLPIRVSGMLGHMSIEGQGWQEPWSGTHLPPFELRLAMNSPGLRVFDGRLLPALPETGPARMELDLRWDGTVYSARNLLLEVKGRNGHFEARGEIPDLVDGEDLALDLKLGSTRAAALLKEWGIDALPGLSSLQASGRVRGDYEQPALESLSVRGDGKALKLEADGGIANLLDGEGMAVTLKLASSRPADLLKGFGVEAPLELQSLQGSGSLAGPYRTLGIRDLDLHLAGKNLKLRARGEVRNLIRLARLEIHLRGEGEFEGRPLSLSVEAGGDRSRAGTPLAVSLKGGGVGLASRGTFVDDEKGVRLDLAVEGSAGDLAQLGRILEMELNPVAPVSMKGRLLLDATSARIRNMRFRAGKSDLAGDINLEWREQKPVRVEGRVSSGMLDLVELLPNKRKVEIELVEKPKEVSPELQVDPGSKKYFSTRPMDFGWLAAVDGRVQFELGALLARAHQLQQLKGELYIRGSELRLDLAEGMAGGKPLKVDFRMQAGEKPQVVLKLQLQEADLATLLPAVALNADSGRISLDIDMQARGRSEAELAATLDGELVLLLQDSPFGFGLPNELGRSLLNRFNPAARKKGKDRIECGAAWVKFTEGVATTPRGIAIVFPEVTWLGEGTADLGKETLFATLKPRPRKGLGLSFKGIAELVAVSGTFSSLNIVIDPKGTVLSALSLTTAVATGGASLLVEGLWDRLRADEDVCGYIVTGEKEKKGAPVSPAKSSPAASSLEILDDQ